MMADEPVSVIAVLLNIGHSASHRSVILQPHGYTHDWEAYVCGADGIELHHFVEKVVFTLHETFTRPVQVVTKPPYKINESGYASFGLKLDIHFANQSCRPGGNIIHYEYDLYLPGEGQPKVSSFRQERLLFKATPPDFRARLLAGGAEETVPGASVPDMAKEREKRLAGAVLDGSASNLPDQKGESDRSNKKKKSKDKEKGSKHKMSKPDRDSSSKSSMLDASSSLFGMGQPEAKPVIESLPTTGLSSNSSSSSSSSSSPSNSPPAHPSSRPTKSKHNSLSGFASSSDSDDDVSNINNSSSKRPGATSSLSNSGTKKSRSSEKPTKKGGRSGNDSAAKGPNGVSLDILLDLHEKIKSLTDPTMLQRCVDAVADTRQYQLTEKTFDFDLCALDPPAIHKLTSLLK